MKTTLAKIITLFCMYLALSNQYAWSQCVWQTQLTDGYEYQTVCPYLIPGTTVHNTPQTFAAYTGTYSLYLNFINCVSGTGTCPGAKVFERAFQVCPNMPLKLSTWITTTFSGGQCDLKVTITDANGTILNNQLNVVAPYNPIWLQYQSGTVIPITDTILFTIYTNIGGGNGNDLSMDDFLMEKCIGGESSTTAGNLCSNSPSENLFTLSPGLTDTTGTWSGPSALTGGYLGTFSPGQSQPGVYVYQNAPYGTGAGCPLAYDSVVVNLLQPPLVNLGADTTICTNQTILLSAGSGAGNTYLWNNGVTGPNVLAFTSSTVTVTNNYSVQVNASNGCSNSDSISVTFEVCSGLGQNSTENNFDIYPNPSNGLVHMNFSDLQTNLINYSIYNSLGSLVGTGEIQSGEIQHIWISNPGIYIIVLQTALQQSIVKKLVIQ